jgi:phosphatidylserine decarboxylase
MIAKDGYSLILITGIVVIILAILAWYFHLRILWILTILAFVIFIFHFFFFRDPDRTPPAGEKLILSPADGKVILIDEVYEPLYCQDTVKHVAIFMSVFNIHINRVPVSGVVELVKHKPGEFLIAAKKDALEKNEQTMVGIRGQYGKIMFRQIAGLIARRIVCRLKEGDAVRAGDRFGMIKYSSRVDIYMPRGVQLKVKVNDSVQGGITVIGEYE